MAGVVGFEPTVHGIKTRGYCYQENQENCCQKCCQKPSLNKIFSALSGHFLFVNFYLDSMKIALRKVL